jgi:O-antigen/teichoic acid export membrane protein
VSGLSLRSNFAWVLAGNVVYAICQWGILVALAKLGSSFMVGQFSLGLAIATPVLMFTNLHLRAVQATDAKHHYSFTEYRLLRSIMTFGAIALITGIAWFQNYARQTTMIVLVVALAKGTETLSDIHYGLFQLNDRLDQTGISMMLRGVFSVVALSAALYLTHSAFWGCVGLALVWLAALLLFDVRRGRRFVAPSERPRQPLDWAGEAQPERRATLQRQWNLMRLALPLGVVTTLASINLNMPRYFIEARLGVHQLGIFSALAYTTVALTLVSDSMGQCAIPRMSRLYAAGEIGEFRSVLLQLSALGCGLGLVGLAAAQVIGKWLLAAFFSPEYAGSSRVFVVLMLATALHCVAGMLTSGIMSARYFQVQVPMLALAVASNAFACYRLVPAMGLAGGAVAMVYGAAVRLVLTASVVAYLFWNRSKPVAGQRMTPAYIDEWNPSL